MKFYNDGHKLIGNLVNENNETVTVTLRLNAGAALALENKLNMTVSEVLSQATDHINILTELLTAALNYKGNNNSIKEGTDLYDLLIENDVDGNIGFNRLIVDLAEACGIYSKSQAKYQRKMIDMMSNIFNEMDVTENDVLGDTEDTDSKN